MTDDGGKTRYLRQTLFGPGGERVTIVVPEAALKADIHAAANSMREQGGDQDVEIFEHGADLEAGTLEGERRAASGRIPRRKKDADTMRDWVVAVLLRLNPGGMLANRTPVPAEPDDVGEALAYASRHPSYRNQIVTVTTKAGPVLRLERGVVLIREIGEGWRER